MTTRVERVYLFRRGYEYLPAYLQQVVNLWLDGLLMVQIAERVGLPTTGTSATARGRAAENMLAAAEWYCRGVVAVLDGQQEELDKVRPHHLPSADHLLSGS